jgi:ribosomal protein L7/L12
MWMFRTAEIPENKAKHNKAIKFILKETGVTLSEARKFYEEAAENYVYDTAYQKLKKSIIQKRILIKFSSPL